MNLAQQHGIIEIIVIEANVRRTSDGITLGKRNFKDSSESFGSEISELYSAKINSVVAFPFEKM